MNTATNHNLGLPSIAIPQSRSEAMALAQEIIRTLDFIERCIDEAITYCEASDRPLPRAA